MNRKSREELKKLSKELLGASSRYKKYVKGVLVDSGEVAANGRPIKVFKYMTEEEILSLLKEVKKNIEDGTFADKVQEMAGGSVE